MRLAMVAIATPERQRTSIASDDVDADVDEVPDVAS
jgi:hypothetical protein